jgi:hypothetical protein
MIGHMCEAKFFRELVKIQIFYLLIGIPHYKIFLFSGASTSLLFPSDVPRHVFPCSPAISLRDLGLGVTMFHLTRAGKIKSQPPLRLLHSVAIIHLFHLL